MITLFGAAVWLMFKLQDVERRRRVPKILRLALVNLAGVEPEALLRTYRGNIGALPPEHVAAVG